VREDMADVDLSCGS